MQTYLQVCLSEFDNTICYEFKSAKSVLALIAVKFEVILKHAALLAQTRAFW